MTVINDEIDPYLGYERTTIGLGGILVSLALPNYSIIQVVGGIDQQQSAWEEYTVALEGVFQIYLGTTILYYYH